MDTILIYASNVSARFRYVVNWLFKEQLQLGVTYAKGKEEIVDAKCVITYGMLYNNCMSIPKSGLLTERGIQVAAPPKGSWDGIPTLFPTVDKHYALPFDIFSAIFFLISRYEEYYNYTPDEHGRYPATNSIMYKREWMRRPIVDEWVSAFRMFLEREFDIKIPASKYSFQPTYDIDMAYSYLHKGTRRIAGGYWRAIKRMDIKEVKMRRRILKGHQQDPYDSFGWLRALHGEHGFVPIFFILAALRTTLYDKNIPPKHPAMVQVIKELAAQGVIGLHPSYYSDGKGVIEKEKEVLEEVVGQQIALSRQHYIKSVLPYAYRNLVKNGITDDYSMGYGTHLGFRAGTSNSFLWFDLERDEVTKLRVHPFCFMDATAHFNEKLSVGEAFSVLEEMNQVLKEVGGRLITVFHNFSLGSDEQWAGWKEAYAEFLEGHADGWVLG